MSNYDFHRNIDRLNTASVKWGLTKDLFGSEDILPMWVADMDFEPPKEVGEALKMRIDHGIFGYTYVPPTVGEAIQAWLKKRHQWDIDPAWLLYSPGVVPSIGIAIQALTNPGDKVLLQSPVYTPFFNMIKNNGRVVVNSPLEMRDNTFHINMGDFEEKLKEGPKLFLLCNPHNPGGKVWKKEELERIAELCLQYDCKIISDEIHSDLIYEPNRHVPIAALNEKYKEHVITFIAPSKTFNLAGLQASAAIIPNKEMRRAFQATQGRLGISSLNTFGIIGMETAYRYGEGWLEELLPYLKENMLTAKQYIEENIPNISVMEPDGTYLLWLDCRKLGLTDEEIKEALLKKGKLGLEPGPKYGTGGEGFVRMNFACTRDTLMEGLERLKKAFS